MGKTYDRKKKDSVQYFQLIPRKRESTISDLPYIKYIVLKDGDGIRDLTFNTYGASYTIRLAAYPRVIWLSDH
ncbi:MAG: hypothetical protein QM762_13560 [Chryseolinea sp.]